ncbi:MAG TPA: hypothetical protein VF704_11180 [Allosphingosinicella sp.]|jgi:hypothetical protein
MPRYHFHIDGDHPSHDDEGTELHSLAVAKCEAIRMAGRIICDAAASFWDRAEWSMTVTDANGLTLLHLGIVGTEAPAVMRDQPRPIAT